MTGPVRAMLCCLLSLAWVSASLAAEDLVVADFEGDTYGEWTVTGNAFGEGPARANVRPRNRCDGPPGAGAGQYLPGWGFVDGYAYFAAL